MSTADRDMVGLLRQRVRAARDGLGVNTERLWEALNDLDAELSNPAEGKAVARALLGEDGTADSTEWCVFIGDRPATGRRMVGLGRSSAEELRDGINTRDFVPGSTLDVNFGDATGAARVAHRTTWQVVDTEGGERDA